MMLLKTDTNLAPNAEDSNPLKSKFSNYCAGNKNKSETKK